MPNPKDDRCTRYDDDAQATDDTATQIANCDDCVPMTREEAMNAMDGLVAGTISLSDICDDHLAEQRETIGDVIAPTLNDAALKDTERVLNRFIGVAVDEYDEVPAWLVTAHSVVQNTREYHDREVKER